MKEFFLLVFVVDVIFMVYLVVLLFIRNRKILEEQDLAETVNIMEALRLLEEALTLEKLQQKIENSSEKLKKLGEAVNVQKMKIAKKKEKINTEEFERELFETERKLVEEGEKYIDAIEMFMKEEELLNEKCDVKLRYVFRVYGGARNQLEGAIEDYKYPVQSYSEYAVRLTRRLRKEKRRLKVTSRVNLSLGYIGYLERLREIKIKRKKLMREVRKLMESHLYKNDEDFVNKVSELVFKKSISLKDDLQESLEMLMEELRKKKESNKLEEGKSEIKMTDKVWNKYFKEIPEWDVENEFFDEEEYKKLQEMKEKIPREKEEDGENEEELVKKEYEELEKKMFEELQKELEEDWEKNKVDEKLKEEEVEGEVKDIIQKD